MPLEAIFFIALVLFLLGSQIAAIVLSLIAIVRSRQVRHLTKRVERLEANWRDSAPVLPVSESAIPASGDRERERGNDVAAELAGDQPIADRRSVDWERFVGQRALGWVATTLLLFAVAFFLRYAYQNDWIGPLGRVGLSALFGCALVVGGREYFRRNWLVLSQMLTSTGIVVLYLAVYSAYGFYQLLSPQQAGAFLALIVIESMLLAIVYDRVVIGLVAVLGGLMTPLLLHTDRDSYVALFSYLALLDFGTILVLVWKRWPAIGSLALLGTQGLFWIWYAENYHPEKLAWAAGFQLLILGMFLAGSVLEQLVRKRSESWEGLVRVVTAPSLAFLALYWLWRDEYGVWMGSVAVVLATLYAILARVTLQLRPADRRLLLSWLAVSVGFVALAFPIQAEAQWIALGWAATGTALWWFGQRIAAPALRAIAGVLMAAAMLRVMFVDVYQSIPEPFWFLLNRFALPSSCVAICLLLAVAVTRPYLSRLTTWERRGVALTALGGIVLLWLVLTVDCYSFFEAQSRLPNADRNHQRWLGQLSVSILWAVYASVILAAGFRLRLASMRWLAIGVYGMTVTKVLLVDMEDLQQFYRILAFFILAVILGLATRAYQRIETDTSRGGTGRIGT
jgi:uncharacterized membrane protein